MTHNIDQAVIWHLDAWLEHNVRGEYRDRVKARMLELVNDDPDYWPSLGWSRVYDNADCGDIT